VKIHQTIGSGPKIDRHALSKLCVVSFNRGVYTYRDGTRSDIRGNPVLPHNAKLADRRRRLIDQLKQEAV
jgi:hypothetical protein